MAGRKTGSQGLTGLELKILQVLWRVGPCPVQAVQRALEDAFAYTTVQTMLNVLHRKGHAKRRLRGRAYEYYAAVSEEKTLGTAVTDLIDRMFSGSAEDLVMSLVKSRQLDAARLAQLAARVQTARAAKSVAKAGSLRPAGRDRDA